ncbi:hypothetical protein LSH36_141g07029 [Paralvinella palmiformis]|uniref:Uncharacterized protein n=1 Tax=Paralvinella palmiformis TaxID=53620 RepID=A0AAD9JVE4_9ANNE|nr:hypothetical protein LSH36_141g07029 [Paralvinella palmiformis]
MQNQPVFRPLYQLPPAQPQAVTLPQSYTYVLVSQGSSAAGVSAPSQPPTAPVTTQRTWKRADVYYTTDGPFPDGRKSGTLVYFDPSQLK